MAVRQTAEVQYWYRAGVLGDLEGPVTRAELQEMLKSPTANLIECRHAGMPSFVPLTELRNVLRETGPDMQHALQTVRRSVTERLAQHPSAN